ncbi:amidohydrolase family protein [Microbacterium jejuense]|uniref:amidohydrolase family protein n=1 Tax=Microbacterium jejuense TaxID=1263637 RepID=UPI0031E8894B
MIDTHLHVWDRARSSYRWLDGAPERLRGDHLLEQGLAAVAGHGFEAAVLVQADETLDETAYLLELAAADARVAGAVCYLPLEAPAIVAERLPALTAIAGFVGVRNLTHDRSDPDWILGPDQRRSLGMLEAAGVPLDYIAVLPRHRENLVTLARDHAGLTLVLDHLGSPPIGLPGEYRRWVDQVADAATLSNVVAKVSGLYRADPAGIGTAVTADQAQMVLAAALEVFGPDRLMLGSDWPMGTVSGTGAATLDAVVAAVDALEPDQAHALRRATAARVYGLVV